MREFAYLELGQFERAIRRIDAKPAASQFAYAAAWRAPRSGDAAGGRADIAAAKAIEPDIVEDFYAHYGVRE